MCRRRLRREYGFPCAFARPMMGDAGGFDADAAPHGRHARPRLRKMASKCQRRHEPPVRHCRTPGEVADAMKKTRNSVNINCLSHSAKASGESARHARRAQAPWQMARRRTSPIGCPVRLRCQPTERGNVGIAGCCHGKNAEYVINSVLSRVRDFFFGECKSTPSQPYENFR